MNRKEFYNTLSEDVKKKIKACKSEEEMKALLKGAQIELPDELLEAVSGGWITCAKCVTDCGLYLKCPFNESTPPDPDPGACTTDNTILL